MFVVDINCFKCYYEVIILKLYFETGGNLYLFSSSGSYIKVNTDTLHETKFHQVQATAIGPRSFIIRDLWTDGKYFNMNEKRVRDR